MVALSQHQEAECPDYGGDQQGQKNVFPAAVWERKIKINCSIELHTHNIKLEHIQNNQSHIKLEFAIIVMTLLKFSPTWYLCSSIPVKINIKIAKQHAANKI